MIGKKMNRRTCFGVFFSFLFRKANDFISCEHHDKLLVAFEKQILGAKKAGNKDFNLYFMKDNHIHRCKMQDLCKLKFVPVKLNRFGGWIVPELREVIPELREVI